MSVSNDFVVYAIEQLAPLAKVTSRRMFGGVGLYAEGLFFGLIADDTLYLKVDDSNRTDYEQRGSKPFCPYPDRLEFSMSYFDVPADLLDDADELSRWARKSVAIALSTANEKARRVTKRINRAGKPTRKAK
jgi:DNA transformation protein